MRRLSQWFRKRHTLHVLLTEPRLGRASRLIYALVNSHHLLIWWLLLRLLRADSILNKLSESLHGHVAIFPTMSGLVCDEPGKNVLVGIEPTLLVSDVVTLATLLIELGETVGCMLERVFEGFKM